MAYVPPRFAALNGARSTSPWPRSMSEAGRTESQAAVPRARSYAPVCLWLCAGKCRSRYPHVTGLPRAQEYPVHGAVHRVGTDALQGLLALTIHGTSQKVPDFRQQVSRIVAWPTFDSGKVRGASNIGGCSGTARGRRRILSQRRVRQGHPAGNPRRRRRVAPEGPSPAKSWRSGARSSGFVAVQGQMIQDACAGRSRPRVRPATGRRQRQSFPGRTDL
jgi:hypothetical protein